jgi:DNA-directed RNA polymerase subunit alpha
MMREPISVLLLSERPASSLRRAQITTIGDLLAKTADDLLGITYLGHQCLDEVIDRLSEFNLELGSAQYP